MPEIDALLRTPQFRGPVGRLGPAPQTAFPPAAASAPHALTQLLAAFVQPPAPLPPALPPARPQAVSVDAMQRVIAEALAHPASGNRPLWFSANTLAAHGIEQALAEATVRLRLHVARNFDARGGALVAPSPEILQEAERLRDRGQSVPIIPVELGGHASEATRPGGGRSA
jgi:hypothetical protein